MKKKAMKAAMVVFSGYPYDVRVRREAEALCAEGMTIDLFCLQEEGLPARETIGAIQVYRLPVQRRRGGKLRYFYEYGTFILLSALAVALLHCVRRYRLVHVHNMPDILVVAALFPRLTGAKVILDLHDPMPELYMTKFGIGERHPVIRLLRFLEKVSIGMAHLVLTPNLSFRNLFVARSCPADKIHIVMNSPQENIFRKREPVDGGQAEGFVVMFNGVVAERSGVGPALDALCLVRDRIPGLRMDIYGDGEDLERVLRRVTELGLDDVVKYHGSKSLEEIAEEIRRSSCGIVPNIMSPFTNLNLPTRIMEFLALGKPVVAPRTQGIRDYFDEGSLFFFDAGNAESLARALLEIYRDPARCREVTERGAGVYAHYRWEKQRQHLLELVVGLVET